MKNDEFISFLSLDYKTATNILFSDKHFLNSKINLLTYVVLGNFLGKNLSANKLEKFLAERL